MERAVNVAFVAIVACALFSVVGYGLLAWVSPAFQHPEKSEFEGRAYVEQPMLTKESFKSREFQEQFAQYVADNVPCRDQIVIANATTQRTLIGLANTAFGFDAYPTYFGSGRVYVPSAHAVTYMPEPKSEYLDNQTAWFAEQLVSLAKEFPDKRFVVFTVGGYQIPTVNPAYDLVYNAFTPQYFDERLKQECSGQANITILDMDYDSVEDYYREFFRSDHHWNEYGALRAYNTIAEKLGLEQIEPSERMDVDVSFTGATARWGLTPVEDDAFYLNADWSFLEGTNKKGESFAADERSRYLDAAYDERHFFFYDRFYDGKTPDVIVNGSVNDGSALLATNSFGAALRNYLASQYHALHNTRTAHPSTDSDFSVREALEEDPAIKDVFIVASIYDMLNLANDTKRFFM